ncbi:helix-turn-helix domain-containing protein [Exiguobacterium oxidotolerans]|uniref:Helix-turn-helix domain protein n=1 Tax=Exiguobacterium oxidotolerans TaxID=223958 RepID=A0A653IGZ8_9BACL|nr:helix-turn-helix domain-containing protein [Exiguobacterium oxidotolerans]VWX38534.1 Helix-turn-helix domain protein [Exiguobacterium oxidotolerans]
MDQFTSPQIGLALRRLRKKHNLTQKDLANGICSQAEISKIESGTHSPTVELLFLISKKLQVPFSAFFDHANYRESFYQLDDELLKKFRNNEFKEIYEITNLKLQNVYIEEEIALLLQFYNSISAHRLQKTDYRTCIVVLRQLSEKYSSTFYSPSMIIRIKSAIANLYSENKSYKHSRKVYEELIKLDFESNELLLDRIRILYNFSKTLLQLKESHYALNIVQEAIQQSLRFKDMSLLGQLYYQQGLCLESLNYDKEFIKQSYFKANVFFELLNMDEYHQIILKHKSEFL